MNIVRGVPVWGREQRPLRDHLRRTCACRSRTSSAARGSGHQAAQDRLGAGRVYHCMNSVGQMWRAFDLMVRARARRARCTAASSRPSSSSRASSPTRYIDIQAARLMTHPLRRADGQRRATRAPTSPRSRSSCPRRYHRVVDRAIQVWGAAGVSGDLPLAGMYQGARTLRIADGPDEVHKILIAKNVLKRYHAGEALGLRELACAAQPRSSPCSPSSCSGWAPCRPSAGRTRPTAAWTSAPRWSCTRCRAARRSSRPRRAARANGWVQRFMGEAEPSVADRGDSALSRARPASSRCASTRRRATGPFPVVAWIHGGGFWMGDDLPMWDGDVQPAREAGGRGRRLDRLPRSRPSIPSPPRSRTASPGSASWRRTRASGAATRAGSR